MLRRVIAGHATWASATERYFALPPRKLWSSDLSEREPALALFARRLGRGSPLTDADTAAIVALPGSARTLERANYIVREGEPGRSCAILLSGYTFRQKLTSDGARQIVSLHIPGDALDLQTLHLAAADHNVQALTRAKVLYVPQAEIRQLMDASPGFAEAVIVDILIEASITREWLLNVGRRDARTRLAHLLCEFAVRMDAQGLTNGHGCELPMTQEQLGDALGLTSVHVNRTLKALESAGVLTRRGRRIQFTDWEKMRRIADFSALYLHLDQVGRPKADRG